jgi:hypothetical protein
MFKKFFSNKAAVKLVVAAVLLIAAYVVLDTGCLGRVGLVGVGAYLPYAFSLLKDGLSILK